MTKIPLQPRDALTQFPRRRRTFDVEVCSVRPASDLKTNIEIYAPSVLRQSQYDHNCLIKTVITRVTENSVSTIEFYRLFLTKSNGLC